MQQIAIYQIDRREGQWENGMKLFIQDGEEEQEEIFIDLQKSDNDFCGGEIKVIEFVRMEIHITKNWQYDMYTHQE